MLSLRCGWVGEKSQSATIHRFCCCNVKRSFFSFFLNWGDRRTLVWSLVGRLRSRYRGVASFVRVSFLFSSALGISPGKNDGVEGSRVLGMVGQPGVAVCRGGGFMRGGGAGHRIVYYQTGLPAAVSIATYSRISGSRS